jgi:hypothetical protein
MMTANELRDLLVTFCARNGGRNGESVIVVPTANGSAGPSACSKVTGMVPGFDWDKGRVFLCTEDSLVVENRLPVDLSTLAAERLAHVREGHAMCGFDYLPKSQSRAWCEGFKVGAREHFTGEAKP